MLSIQQSKASLNQYSKGLNDIAVLKYAYKPSNYDKHHENIVNRPNIMLFNQLQ